MVEGSAGVIPQLRARLGRHPRDRFPVQHATDQFHLGAALLQAGRPEEAEEALLVARDGFDPSLPLEQAKASNLLGISLRLQGRLHEAATAFDRAGEGFAALGHPLEQGAALYNAGLVARELEDAAQARDRFRRAWTAFDGGGALAHAGAAARELGAVRLDGGDAEGAIDDLRRALDLSRRAGDPTGEGAAANALGLAQLARGRPEEAVEALRSAVAASPRGVRPEAFAMAKANLALAYATAGNEARARLSARQALGAPEVPEVVASQAHELLERLGPAGDDLFTVLEVEPVERWSAVVREEVVWWAEAADEARDTAVRHWVRGQLARPRLGPDLAEAWLAVLLELPPAALETMTRSTVGAVARIEPGLADRFRTDVARALVRFHAPQWLRLKDTFNRVAAELGEDGSWG